MKSNKQFIDEIYEKYDEYNKEKQDNKQRNIKKIVNMAAVVLVVFSSLIVFSNEGVQKYNTQNSDSNTIMQESMNIKSVGNFENFCEIIKNKNLKTMNSINSVMEITDTEEGSTYSSKTNTQVENVDESDIVKVYGNYIYYIANNNIVIIDASNAENSNKIAEINYAENNFYPREIYVKNDKLIVVGSEDLCYTTDCKVFSEDVKYSTNQIKTGMILYDISNIKEFKEIRRVMLQGSYVSSRMIDNNVYFVASNYINTASLNETEDLNEDDYKIKYIDTLISEEENSIGFDKIYDLEGSEDASYLTLVGLNIENEEEADIKTFLGAGQYVYFK